MLPSQKPNIEFKPRVSACLVRPIDYSRPLSPVVHSLKIGLTNPRPCDTSRAGWRSVVAGRFLLVKSGRSDCRRTTVSVRQSKRPGGVTCSASCFLGMREFPRVKDVFISVFLIRPMNDETLLPTGSGKGLTLSGRQAAMPAVLFYGLLTQK